MILETERLILREMDQNDYENLYAVLADSDIMEHYPYTFDEFRVRNWITRNIERYETDGFGLWAVVLKDTGEMIGDCGITLQPIHGQWLPEIGYHIRADHQRKGYASEAAAACIRYAFENYDFPAVYDNDTDPVHSLIYAILQTVESDFKFRESSGLIRLAAGFVDAFQGTSISNLLDLLHGEDPLAAIGAQKKVEQQFAEFLESLLTERGNRLVVFVDELDRCNPSFAVKLLERIKHYFFNDRITFVFSVNINELQHTIKKHYGADFDACRYLDRFFDFRLTLPPVDMDVYFRNAGLAHGHYVYDGICKSLIDMYGFTFRESTKFLQTAFAAAYRPTHDEKKRFIFSDGRGEFFCIASIVPLLIALRIKDYARYNSFVSGDDSTPLHELFNFSNSVRGLKNDLLADNETYRTAGEAGAGTAVSLTEKLNQVYDAVFVNPYTNGNYEINVGNCSFSKSTRDLVLRISSAMSEYADFTV